MATVTTERDSLSAYGEARSTIEGTPLDPDELRLMDAYWRASLYLCLGMIYLKDNPLLREPLTLDHLKVRLLGHWGSDPGQSLVYVHLNRLIKKYDLDAIFLSGPGHGAPALISNAYLEGTYSEVYPDKGQDADGLRQFFKQFSFPGGSAATARRRPRARSTRGANSATPSPTPTGRPSTPRAAWSWSWSATARRRPGRWRPPGTRTSSSTPPATAPCCRCCTSTATRSTTRRSSPGSAAGSSRRCSRGTATRRTSSRAPSRTACTRRWPRRSSTAWARSSRSRRRPGRSGSSGGPPGRWSSSAARRAGRPRARWTATTSKATGGRTRCRWATCGRTPRTWRSWNAGCDPTGRIRSSMRRAG